MMRMANTGGSGSLALDAWNRTTVSGIPLVCLHKRSTDGLRHVGIRCCGTLPFMYWMRGQLVRVAAGWLVLHLGLLVSVPTTLCAITSASTLGAQCTCDHGDGQMCPMHHGRSNSSSSKSGSQPRSCSCRSTSDPIAAIAASLIGPVAVLGLAQSICQPTLASGRVAVFNPQPLESSHAPASPPPRG
jgi:hypothetical protein